IPSIIIGDAVVNEEDGTITFKVSLTNPSDSEITVDYETVDGTALSGSDYTTTSGKLTFPADTTVQYITVPVLDDSIYEDDESFSVLLSNAVNAEIADEEGVGTIKDNDLPSIEITDTQTTEGDYAEFVVSLSNASEEDIKVSLTPTAGTATEGDDYNPTVEVLVNGVWTAASEAIIPAGETQVVARIKTEEDAVSESTEEFTLTATVIEGTTSNTEVTGTAEILDDD
ncbi:Calx-beta domain-containing protein, partial [Malaciobacter pacificus]